MISTTTTASSLWAGLIAASSHNEDDTRTLQELLGNEAPILIVQPGDLPQDAVRVLISRKFVNVIAITDSAGLAAVTPILSLASTMASFRRLLVLHDGSSEGLDQLVRGGVLILRDCEEVRAALRPSLQAPIDTMDSDCSPEQSECSQALFRSSLSHATTGSIASSSR